MNRKGSLCESIASVSDEITSMTNAFVIQSEAGDHSANRTLSLLQKKYIRLDGLMQEAKELIKMDDNHFTKDEAKIIVEAANKTHENIKRITNYQRGKVAKVQLPADKVTTTSFANGSNLPSKSGEKITKLLKAEPNGASVKASIEAVYWYDPEAEGTERIQCRTPLKEMSGFTKQVMMVLGTIYESVPGLHVYTTAQQIYEIMNGGTGRSSAHQKRQILEAVKHLNCLSATIDNSDEAEKLDRVKRQYLSGTLINATLEVGKINGKVTENAIKLLDEPLLFRWAKERRQIVSIDAEAFGVPVSRTEKNAKILNYMLWRIELALRTPKPPKQPQQKGHTKDEYAAIVEVWRRDCDEFKRKRTHTKTKPFLVSTIFEKTTKDLSRKDDPAYNQARAIRDLMKTLSKMLDYWASINYISGWRIVDDGELKIMISRTWKTAKKDGKECLERVINKQPKMNSKGQ